jgi:hypothetical protein
MTTKLLFALLSVAAGIVALVVALSLLNETLS